MLVFSISVLIMLAMLDRAVHGLRLEGTQMEARFKLFRLRDELRMATIDGTIPYNEFFRYLDTTLSRTIENIRSVNLWEGFSIYLDLRNDREIRKATQWLDAQLKQSENRGMLPIYAGYSEVLAELLSNRHILVRNLCLATGRIANFMSEISKFKRSIAESYSRAPQTSTLIQHCA